MASLFLACTSPQDTTADSHGPPPSSRYRGLSSTSFRRRPSRTVSREMIGRPTNFVHKSHVGREQISDPTSLETITQALAKNPAGAASIVKSLSQRASLAAIADSPPITADAAAASTDDSGDNSSSTVVSRRMSRKPPPRLTNSLIHASSPLVLPSGLPDPNDSDAPEQHQKHLLDPADLADDDRSVGESSNYGSTSTFDETFLSPNDANTPQSRLSQASQSSSNNVHSDSVTNKTNNTNSNTLSPQVYPQGSRHSYNSFNLGLTASMEHIASIGSAFPSDVDDTASSDGGASDEAHNTATPQDHHNHLHRLHSPSNNNSNKPAPIKVPTPINNATPPNSSSATNGSTATPPNGAPFLEIQAATPTTATSSVPPSEQNNEL